MKTGILLAARLTAVGLTLSLAACVTPEPMVAPIDYSALDVIKETGTASVAGQAFARQRGGGVVTAAGETIHIVPATPYMRELTDKQLVGTAPQEAIDLVWPYRRSTTADADGRFQFTDLKAGTYLVLAVVRWEVPSQYGPVAQGGMFKREVTVAEGEHASLIMAR